MENHVQIRTKDQNYLTIDTNALQGPIENVGANFIESRNCFVDPSQHNFALRPSSRSIDKATHEPDITYDLLKTKRPVDGNGDGTAQSDVGAFEYVP